jgi:hypothetical protein
MVPLSVSPPAHRLDQLIQSVDFAIRDLLASEDDPFALAVYLWVMRRHRLSLINGDRLAAWGGQWVRQILIDGAFGRRRDEQIASAAIAAIALEGTRALVGLEGTMRDRLSAILAVELERRSIPFGRPSYAAPVLLACATFRVDDPRLTAATDATLAAFAATLLGGRLFGVGFAVALAQLVSHRHGHVALDQRVPEILADPQMSYEDRLYLLQGIWLARESAIPREERRAVTEQTLEQSPIWPYLMSGMEDLPPAGDGRAVVVVSHLYRAVLLDIALCRRAETIEQVAILSTERRTARWIIDWSALGFGIALLLGAWLLLGWLARPWIGTMRRYWLLRDYDALSRSAALMSLASGVAVTLLLPLSVAALWILWSLLVREGKQGNQRITQLLGLRLRRVTIWWALAVALAAAINLATGVLGPAFEHLLGVK